MLDPWKSKLFVAIKVDFYHVELGIKLRFLESCLDGSFVFPVPTPKYYSPNHMLVIALLANVKQFKIFDNLYLLGSNCKISVSSIPSDMPLLFSLQMSSCLLLLTPNEMQSVGSHGWKAGKGFQVSDLRRSWLAIIAALREVTSYPGKQILCKCSPLNWLFFMIN